MYNSCIIYICAYKVRFCDNILAIISQEPFPCTTRRAGHFMCVYIHIYVNIILKT